MRKLLLFFFMSLNGFFPFLLFRVPTLSAQSVQLHALTGALQIEQRLGTNINLKMAHHNANLFGDRCDVVPQGTLGLKYFAASGWGAFANVNVKYYITKREQSLPDAIVSALFWGFEHFKPTLDAGVLYRFDRGCWEVYPMVGVGYGCYDYSRNDRWDRVTSEGETYVSTRKMQGGYWYLTTGVNVSFRLAPMWRWVTALSYQHPLTTLSLTETTTKPARELTNDEKVRIDRSENTVRSHGLLRDLSLTTGIAIYIRLP